MDLKKIVKLVTHHVSENKVNYLTAAGIAFEVAAIALTFKAAPKCRDIVERNAEHEKIRGEKLTTREKAEPIVKELALPALCAAVSIGCQIGACKVSNRTMKALKTLETAYTGVSTAYMLQKKELEKLPEEQRQEAEKRVDKGMVAAAKKGEPVYIDTGTGDEIIVDGVTGQILRGSRGAFSIIFADQKERLIPDTEGGEGLDDIYYSEVLDAFGGKSEILAGKSFLFTAANRRNMGIRFVQMDGGDKPWWLMKVTGLVMEEGVYLE